MAEKKRTFDKSQTAAINARINSVVSAGAGSGKTTVLAERFSHLVLEQGYKVEEILTLTFTKKATVEMSDRIYKVLKKQNPAAASDFYKANIKTLDSYCASVAKMGSHFFGISPDFVQDPNIEERISAMALPFILQHRDNLAIKRLVDTKDFAVIANQLFVHPILENSTVAEPIDFAECLKFQCQEVINAWKTNCEETFAILNDFHTAFQEFDGNRTSACINNIEEFFTQNGFPEPYFIQQADIEKSACPPAAEFILFIQGIIACGSPSRLKNAESLTDCYKLLKERLPILESLLNYVEGFELTQQLFPLLEEFQQNVNDLKRSTGSLTFKDIASLALCILRDYPEIRQIEKQRYKAIMIDEFQDNNSQQRDILFMLAEKPERTALGVPTVSELCPEKLFFVGDEKQSIYLFRGADVSVFRSLSDDFAAGNLNMATNYRSKQALISAFNTIFGGFPYGEQEQTEDFAQPAVFYTERQAKRLEHEGVQIPKYEAIYKKVTMPEFVESELANATEEQKKQLFAPAVHFALYEKNQEVTENQLGAVEAEALWIAKKIQKLISQDGRKPQDIAILMRNYSLQPLYERTLLNQGIPYNTETVTGFFNDGPVNDIFAFLSLCLNGKNQMAYFHLLRSPFVNLTLSESNAIVSQKEAPFSEKAAEILCKESKVRFLHAKTEFERLSEYVRNVPLTKVVSELWYTLGYRYETLWNQTVELYGKMYDLVFELARQSEENNDTLANFLNNLEAFKDEHEKLQDMDIPLEQKPGVHILTIHKSKGLEYPVVFICGTHKGSGRDINSEAIYSSREFGITVNNPGKTNYFYTKVQVENRRKHAAELRRLVYVAITRAKEEVFITNGGYSFKEDANEKYSPGGTSCPETIFSVLEPVFNYFCEGDFSGKNPFDVEQIPPYERSELFANSGEFRKNTLEQKRTLIAKISSSGIYEKSDVITTDFVESPYIRPSRHNSSADQANSEEILKNTEILPHSPQPELFEKITQIIESTIPQKTALPQDSAQTELQNAEPKFGYNHFGTLAHAYMESQITGQKPEYSEAILSGLENNQAKIDTIKEICVQMAQIFAKSELGNAVKNSTWKKAEYEFKLRHEEKIVRGIIDLVFKNADGTFTVVDYKTDRLVRPELYAAQLAWYKKAVSQMQNIPENAVKVCLYYLRYGKTYVL